MTTTLMMMNICCPLHVGERLTGIRFRPLSKSGFQALQRLGKQFVFRQSRGVIRSSNSAIRCKVTGSLSPSLAVRRMVSAVDWTCVELTGSGNVATAASIAIFIIANCRLSLAETLRLRNLSFVQLRSPMKQMKSASLAGIYGNA